VVLACSAAWQEAAASAGDAELELRCRLAALQHLLPALPDQAPGDEGRLAAPAGPPPKAVKEVHKPPKAALTRVRDPCTIRPVTR
jgi:hypothetical protein